MTLSVIGAGLGRTGTLSLKHALEELGFGPCYHMAEVFKLPNASAQWIDAAAGKPDWEAIFDGYHSTVDWPSCEFYKELAGLYPDAKVILSLRDPEAWYASTQATIFNFENHSGAPEIWFEMVARVIGDKFGGDLRSKDNLIATYNRHNEEVARTIPADRLLVYEPGQGWEPLCGFLGVPVPKTPYPKINTTEQFQARVAASKMGV